MADKLIMQNHINPRIRENDERSLLSIASCRRFGKILVFTNIFIFAAATILAQGTYPKIEAAFTINTPIADPFDYSNDVRVLIVQPDATTISLPAFFDGGTTWRVRHTPTIPGVYGISN